jgi:putative endonuclease
MGGMDRRRAVGQRGESVAAAHLQREGFEIVARNARVGRLELDIVARRGRLLVICEVRALSSDWMYAPAETVDRRKQTRLRRAAARWLAENDPGPVEVRFDVASVVFDGPGGRPRVDYYEGAF